MKKTIIKKYFSLFQRNDRWCGRWSRRWWIVLGLKFKVQRYKCNIFISFLQTTNPSSPLHMYFYFEFFSFVSCLASWIKKVRNFVKSDFCKITPIVRNSAQAIRAILWKQWRRIWGRSRHLRRLIFVDLSQPQSTCRWCIRNQHNN